MLYDVEKLRLWVHKVLPLVYDDSLSYYEVLAKTVQKLNEVIQLTSDQNEYLEQWLTNTNSALNEWKQQTGDDIAAWEREVNADIVQWKGELEAQLNTDLQNAITALQNEFDDELEAAENAADNANSYAENAAEYAERAENAAETAAEDAVDAVMPTLRNEFDEVYAPITAVGSPLVATLASQMTDTSKVYVYAGSETGMTNGDWYYYNGTDWVSGGVYNAVAIVTDPTLTQSGVPADAKATGDELTDLKSAIDDIEVANLLYPVWEQGYIKEDDGTVGADTKACVTPLIQGHGYKITVTVNENYRTKAALYDSQENYIAMIYTSAYGNKEFWVADGNYVRIQIASDSKLLPRNVRPLIAINEIEYVDNILTKSGKAADAKAVLDRIHGIVNDGYNDFTVTKGLYQRQDGVYYDRYDEYAATEQLSVFSEKTIYAKIGTDYNFTIRVWDENDNYVPSMATDFVKELSVFVPAGHKIAFVFINNSTTALNSADYAAIKASFEIRTPIVFSDNVVASGSDFDDLLTTGTYRIPSTTAGTHDNSPTADYGRLIVFGSTDNYSVVQIYTSYKNNVYSRFLTNRDNNTWTAWATIYSDSAIDISAYIHDGDVLRMNANPESIPVNENHSGYNDFISSTWETLLPDNYSEGDAYNENTTKIINTHVERETDWQSTPYGANQDVYNIYRYTFTPINGYKRTVFLSAGCHGNEAEGYWGLYRLIRMIYFDSYKYPTLRNIRDNVRFIIVPSWNPWGMQNYRRFNAFESDTYQAWKWLYAPNNQVTVDGVVYDISDVGEAAVIWDTLNDYSGQLDLWIDMHTDPYAGRTTSPGEIDDPRGYTQPYGFYGFVKNGTATKGRLRNIMEDYYNMLKNDLNFSEKWHLPSVTANASGGFSAWMASLDFKTALVEVSTFMTGFPYASGSAGMMKLAQEYYGTCLTEFIR